MLTEPNMVAELIARVNAGGHWDAAGIDRLREAVGVDPDRQELSFCVGCGELGPVARATADADPLCAACAHTRARCYYVASDRGRLPRDEARLALSYGTEVWVAIDKGTGQTQLARCLQDGTGYMVLWPALRAPRPYQATTAEAALSAAEKLVSQRPPW